MTEMTFSHQPSHTDQEWNQILTGAKRDEPSLHLNFGIWTMDTRCVLAATDSTHWGRKTIYFEWSKMNHSRVLGSGYTRFRGVPGVGSYVINEWWLVETGHWIEYQCGVKSETINLNRRLDLSSAWIWFLSEEIFGCILRVSLKYVSCVFGYDTSTRYRLAVSLSLDEYRYTVLDRSEECQGVDSDSPLQLTVNNSTLVIQWISRILSQF